MIFSEMELKHFDSVQKDAERDVQNGKTIPLSTVMMSLQFAIVMPNKHGEMWFEDEMSRLLVLASVKKVMDNYPPDMFSVSEKAFLFSVLQMGHLLRAVDNAGMVVKGFTKSFGMKPTEDTEYESDNE